MKNVFIESTNIITSLGFTTAENVAKVFAEQSGLQLTADHALSPDVLPISRIDNARLAVEVAKLPDANRLTRLEQLAVVSATEALSHSQISVAGNRSLLILSSTKGNINSLSGASLEQIPDEVWLGNTAQRIARYLGFDTMPQIINNACISGLVACIVGKRMIQIGDYDNVVVIGVDELSRFVTSGFQSFKSVSAEPCKPYDAARNGLSIGEGVATIVLTSNRDICGNDAIEIASGATSNDANHISGPSRTGEGLYRAICKTMQGFENVRPDFISAHGTATLYNDDMESIAITRANLADVPVVGVKGYIGHTLGAAGAIETAMSAEFLRQNMLVRTLGFDTLGTIQPITISNQTRHCSMSAALKVASGFGGCNAAALFIKH